MIDQPLVSVLMVSYNSAEFIREAIDSVLLQTYKHFELIISDDNSFDDTWNIVSSYSDTRIRKYRNVTNLGEYANRNEAIALAQGEYLIFIDADDIVYTHGLEFMMRYALAFRDCAMVISRHWDERIIFPKKISSHDFYCFEYLDTGISGANFTKVLFRTDVLRGGEPFPKHVKFGDCLIQYEVALRHSSLLIPDASTWWRRRSGQASEKLINDFSVYLLHELWIKIDKLHDPECPLNDQQKDLAFLNLYGNYARFLLRRLLKLKFKSVARLLRRYPVPGKYWRSIWTRQKRNYFSRFSGDFPMKETKVSYLHDNDSDKSV